MATKRTNVQWIDELPARPNNLSGSTGRPVKYTRFAAALQAKPGKWALLDEFDGRHPQQTAQSIKRGILKAFEGGGYEASTRAGEIYVRYVGV